MCASYLDLFSNVYTRPDIPEFSFDSINGKMTNCMDKNGSWELCVTHNARTW